MWCVGMPALFGNPNTVDAMRQGICRKCHARKEFWREFLNRMLGNEGSESLHRGIVGTPLRASLGLPHSELSS